MDASRVAILRQLLAGSGWVERAGEFASTLRRSARPGGLLLVGTPEEEPWHLAAHLSDESRYAGLPELEPTLVRWNPPLGAPAHLSVGLARLEATERGETLFVVAPQAAPVPLLERIDDARRIGATILSLHAGDRELAGLSHEFLTVPGVGATRQTSFGLHVPAAALQESMPELDGEILSMEVVQHLVSSAAADDPSGPPGRARGGLRERLARLLDLVSGPTPSDYR